MPASDWTQPLFVETPGDLGPVLRDARLLAVENDRPARTVRLRFALPEGSGIGEVRFAVEGATHLASFVYLPPAAPFQDELSPEEAVATVGDWARQGLVATADPLAFGTPLMVQRAFLHAADESSTLVVEGYGADADALVWWEVRVSGARLELPSDEPA